MTGRWDEDLPRLDRSDLQGFSRLFAKALDWRYSDFRKAEKASNKTNEQDLVLKLLRATRNPRTCLRALQEFLDRTDGKVAQLLDIEYPRFFMVFPNATSVEGGGDALPALSTEAVSDGVVSGEVVEASLFDSPADAPPVHSGGLRDVIVRLKEATVSERLLITKAAEEIDALGYSPKGDPLVKSVLSADLYALMGTNANAIYEVIEQIDGKVAEKVKLLGDDVYVQNYALTAPRGATLNAKGQWQIEMTKTTSVWGDRLAKKANKGRLDG